MSIGRREFSQSTLANIHLRIDTIRDEPVYDPDAPAYIASGDPDDMPVIGYHSYYRAALLDEKAQQRKVLAGPLALTPEALAMLLKAAFTEIEHYITSRSH